MNTPAGEFHPERGVPHEQPGAVKTFKRLSWVSAILYVAVIATKLLAVARTYPGTSQEQSGEPTDAWAGMDELIFTVATTVAVVPLVVGLALYVTVVVGLYANMNWARVLGMVCAVPSVLWFVVSLARVPFGSLSRWCIGSLRLSQSLHSLVWGSRGWCIGLGLRWLDGLLRRVAPSTAPTLGGELPEYVLDLAVGL